jgi:uncharacterized protein
VTSDAPTAGRQPVVRFLLIGAYLGLVLTKGEAVSWYRIQEMFRFQDVHMFGIIGGALAVGLLTVWAVRRFRLRALDGSEILIEPKEPGWRRALFGGSVFGLGWAVTGACPGPIAALVGALIPGYAVVLLGALLGTYAYAQVRRALPH